VVTRHRGKNGGVSTIRDGVFGG